jgi:hypothetical protein
MSSTVAASGVVLINLFGNISSLVNSSVIGYVREASGSYELAVLLLVAILGIAAVLVAVIALLSARAQGAGEPERRESQRSGGVAS